MPTVTLTAHWAGLAALLVFALAYGLAMFEERLQVRKSVPVLIGAACVWVLVGIGYTGTGHAPAAGDLARHTLLEFAELFLFLIPAMTFVNTLEERGLFDVLRTRLVRSGVSLRAVFWITGGLAFVISPVADNLTTALLVGAVAMAVGRGNSRFVPAACVNIVVAANAGGAFSPFGDITTLMVWQSGHVPFADFFGLAVPSLVNWLVPAGLLSWTISGQPAAIEETQPELEPGAWAVLGLFLATIALTVALYGSLALPPALGMMAGLGLLKGYSYAFNRRHQTGKRLIDELDDVFAEPQLEGEDRAIARHADQYGFAQSGRTATLVAAAAASRLVVRGRQVTARPLDIFALLEKIQWDTLLFFYGVLMGVGGLGALGYLALTSQVFYTNLGATPANVLVGVLSAVVDNVPVMFAVLQMAPHMSQGEWLLATLTTGVGGSLLSIGSAAGVALMGHARGMYTFGAHLRRAWAVGLGYVASIGVHLFMQDVLRVWG